MADRTSNHQFRNGEYLQILGSTEQVNIRLTSHNDENFSPCRAEYSCMRLGDHCLISFDLSCFRAFGGESIVSRDTKGVGLSLASKEPGKIIPVDLISLDLACTAWGLGSQHLETQRSLQKWTAEYSHAASGAKG